MPFLSLEGIIWVKEAVIILNIKYLTMGLHHHLRWGHEICGI